MFLVKDYKKFLKNLPQKPGVYQMFDAGSKILYVGKAKNLKKRVTSYFQTNHGSDAAKTIALMEKVHHIEVTITANEYDALLLENNLIKEYLPRYNILFKDDKSFPYLALSRHKFPRLFVYRGAKVKDYDYFGPYTSAAYVYDILHLAQKVFCIRVCKDTFFSHRTRPCLQHQIGRCLAPCVEHCSVNNYQQNVELLAKFLRGKSQMVLHELKQRMSEASKSLQYEKAAQYRDQIESLQGLQASQVVSKSSGNVDVIAICKQDSTFCIQSLFVRSGHVVGSRAYFPITPLFATQEEVLQAFLLQNYLSLQEVNGVPKKIYLNVTLQDVSLLKALFSKELKQPLDILSTNKNTWMKLALLNAQESLVRHIILHVALFEKFQALQKFLQLTVLPGIIECFDVSHTAGAETVAVCVVFTPKGPDKHAYRRFNIENVAAHDDYAALHQALFRHFSHLKLYPEKMPSVLLIDGGRGQLGIACKVFASLKIENVVLLAVAKDTKSKSSVDQIFGINNGEITNLHCQGEALHLLQQIRDETHRFAVSSHRLKRAKKSISSVLDTIPGVGLKRRLQLIMHFGGLQEMMQASIEELAKAPGISPGLAEKIHQKLQEAPTLRP